MCGSKGCMVTIYYICFVVHLIECVLFQGVQGGIYLLMESMLKRYSSFEQIIPSLHALWRTLMLWVCQVSC